MNKTLLLVICDFLLLNLLALTHWEKAEPRRPEQQPVQAVSAGGTAVTKDQDLVDVMKQSLQDEQTQRQQLAQQLQTTQTALQTREQSVAQLQSEKSQLTSSLSDTQRSAADLSQKVEIASRDAAVSKERLAEMQSALEKRQAEAERQRQQLAQLEKQHAEAQERIESLNVAVKVAEQEKQYLRESAETLKTQVEAERQDRIKVQETTTQLAHGVGQLAEKSTELTKEIRDNRPINANVLFSEFLANRVQTDFAVSRPSLFGPVNRSREAHSVFVTDGKQVFALLHVDDTPFAIREAGPDWEKISAGYSKDAYQAPVPSITFLAVDPRIVVMPVDEAQAKAIGAKIYPMALEPFKFPDAVLISSGGAGYGEVAFKLDPTEQGYVRMDNRIMKRLFGTFSPSRGDLVLSKTGELLGIMVNSDYCGIVNNFLPAKTVHTGEAVGAQHTGTIFEELAGRLRKLPLKLQ